MAPSWRDTIKASAISGMTALGDKRALEVGLRFSTGGNQQQVKSAAIRLIGTLGKDDPRGFPSIAEAARLAVDRMDYSLMAATFEALASLGDSRGLAVFEELGKRTADVPQVHGLLVQHEERLRKSLGTAAKPVSSNP
jgi:hypothetical protein